MVNRVLVVGLDSADWSIIHPLVDSGMMPNLGRLVDGGSSGVLAGLRPLLAPMVWTSVATGCRAAAHGVAGAAEVRPDQGGIQPVGRRSWRAPSFWETLSAAGVSTAIVGWPATRPADGWPGTLIDDSFAEATGADFDTWSLPPHCISPQPLREALRELRVHPSDIAGTQLAALVPSAVEIDQKTDDRLARLAVILAEAATIHAAATHLIENTSWELFAIHYGFLGRVQQQFMRYRSAEAAMIDEDARIFGPVVDSAYRFQDMMLGRLLDLAGSDTDVLIVSANGSMIDPAFFSGPRQGASAWSELRLRDQGVLVAAGPGIARDALVHGVGVLDICPTLLAAFGLAAGAEIAGRVIDEIFAAPPQTLQSGPASAPSADELELSAEETVGHLRVLGYREHVAAPQAQAIEDARVASLINLAESDIAIGAYANAAVFLESARRLQADNSYVQLQLAQCRYFLEDWKACRPLAEAVLEAYPDAPWGHILMGGLLALTGDREAADPHLTRATELGRDVPNARLRLGTVAMQLGEHPSAEVHFQAALRLEPGLAEAVGGIGMACHAQGDQARAEQYLRQAIGLRYYLPLIHLHLGLVLAETGRLVDAAAQLRVALGQQPQLRRAADAVQKIEAAIVQSLLPGGKSEVGP